MSLRQFIDDARRAQWVLIAAGALAAGVLASVNFGWWTYAWGLPLPMRAVGIAAIFAAVIVIWYGVLFTSHYYFGRPKQNPFAATVGGAPGESRRPTLDLFIPNESFDQDMLRLAVTNRGPTDSFAVQLSYALRIGNVIFPLSLRWKDTATEARQIVSGHTHFIEVLRAPQVKNPDTGEFALHQLLLLTPTGEVSVGPEWFVPQVVTDSVFLFLDITSTTSGVATRCELVVDVTVTGKTSPQLLGMPMRGPVKRQAVLRYQGEAR